MNDCTCNCKCKPDSISFFWMHDNHTFVRLKGKNLKEIVSHIKKVRKKSPYGMLCPPTLFKEGVSSIRVGIYVHDNEDFEKNLQKWIAEIESCSMAIELINNGCIAK